MKRTAVLGAARDARLQLTDELRGLAAEQWSAPSLCASWTVRELVAHLVVLDERIYHRLHRLVAGTIRYGGINAFFDQDAKRYASAHTDRQILDAFARTRHETRIVQRYHVWPTFPLVEMVIHGQDIRRPLGLAHALPTEWLVGVADHLTAPMRKPWGADTPAANVRFEATDAEWTSGDGPIARGPLEAIVMTMAGRAAAESDLTGPGAPLLR